MFPEIIAAGIVALPRKCVDPALPFSSTQYYGADLAGAFKVMIRTWARIMMIGLCNQSGCYVLGICQVVVKPVRI